MRRVYDYEKRYVLLYLLPQPMHALMHFHHKVEEVNSLLLFLRHWCTLVEHIHHEGFACVSSKQQMQPQYKRVVKSGAAKLQFWQVFVT
jgi:hypothetical protein